METIVTILLNPFTLLILGFVVVLGFMISPYEVQFDEGDERK